MEPPGDRAEDAPLAAVNQNGIRDVAVPAARGQILDRNDTVLVGNQVEEQIVLDRNDAEKDPAIIAKVAALVGETSSEVTNGPQQHAVQRRTSRCRC